MLLTFIMHKYNIKLSKQIKQKRRIKIMLELIVKDNNIIQTQNNFFTKYKLNLSTEPFLNKKFSIDIFTKLLFGFPDKGIFYSDQYSSSMEKSTSQKSGSNINFIKLGIALKISL